MPRPALLALLALAALSVAACTGERPTLGETVGAAATSTTIEQNPQSLVAEVNGETIDVYPSEGAAAPTTTLAVADQVGKHLVFLVTKDGGDWLEVLLPVAPNGRRGWVRRADIHLTSHDFRIEVSRGDHRVRVYRGATVVLDEPAGIGTTDTPASGTYFITELLEPPDPGGPYGPFAYGLSGFANELTDFGAGDGVIGIHGTNDPAGIGADVQHGCIRISNDSIQRLVKEIGLPLGTPVEIVA